MASAARTLRIVGGLSGEVLCSCQTEPHWTVRELKAQIERDTGTPWESQQLLLEGRVLENPERLDEVAVGGGALDLLLVRLDPRRGTAVRRLQDGKAELEDIDEDLRDDREVVLAALQVDGHALKHASEALRRDVGVVRAALHETAFALQHAPEDMRGDREVVLYAVRRNGQALHHATGDLQNDPEVVLAALREDGARLASKPEELRGAIKCILSRAQGLMDDRTFALSAVRAVPHVFEHVSPRLSAHEDLALAAVALCSDMMYSVAPELRSQKHFVLAAVQANPRCISFAAAHFKEDVDIVMQAAQQHPGVVFDRSFGLDLQ